MYIFLLLHHYGVASLKGEENFRPVPNQDRDDPEPYSLSGKKKLD